MWSNEKESRFMPTKNSPLDVIIITTGGTIEKTYDEFDGSLENRGTFIKNRILSKLRLPYTKLLDQLGRKPWAMELSAKYCFEQIKNVPVPVVFTGAMIPMGFEDSDATQNVTEALLSAKLLSPGFYISFHNQIFKVPHVQKNKDNSTFELKEFRWKGRSFLSVFSNPEKYKPGVIEPMLKQFPKSTFELKE